MPNNDSNLTMGFDRFLKWGLGLTLVGRLAPGRGGVREGSVSSEGDVQKYAYLNVEQH